MDASTHTWWDWGYYGVFAGVFLEQVGVPIPAFPVLLAAGTLTMTGELTLTNCILVSVLAALIADLIWYFIGRSRGASVLNLMCRVSWKPDTCVSKTKTLFSQYGTATLLFAKYFPGLSTLAPPLAGMMRISLVSFVIYDSIGAVLWALFPLLVGAYLAKGFATLETQVDSLKGWLPWLAGAAILAVLIWRYLNRFFYKMALRKSLLEAIEVADLKARLDRGEDLTLIDVRGELDAQAQTVLLPQARWIPYSALPNRLAELALDKPIVTYCDCPADEAAVTMANFLREKGGKDVRPLKGGLKAWLEQGWPTAELNASLEKAG